MLKSIPLSQWGDVQLSHLLNRAGFGKAPAQGAPDVGAGPEAWVDRLLDTPARMNPSDEPEWVKGTNYSEKMMRNFRDLPETERRTKLKEMQRMNRQHVQSVREWWLDRILRSEEPLQEKLTLFWHGHFVSSSQKVKVGKHHWIQNNLLRYRGLGSFRDLTVAVGRDPAMLIYLDGARSQKGSPNENYARELMELFTLGEGHYTEDDIKAAARAFTGRLAGRYSDKSTLAPRQFDRGEKTFFGQTGRFDDADIVDIILQQQQASRYITRKLWEYFAYAHPEPEIVDSLALTFRENDYQLKPVLREMFLSQQFYSKKAVRTQIKSPVMWLASLARVLDLDPFPTKIGTRVLDQLGQQLLNPPSVKGWDGGRAWVSTTTLIMRNNLAHLLINGGSPGKAGLTGRIREIPQAVMDAMSEQQKQRLETMQQRAKFVEIPSLLRNKSLVAQWRKTSATEKLPLLVRTVYQGPISSASYSTLEKNPNLLLNSSNLPEALQQSIYELVAHPEFQLT
ncbi:MAG: DUF1800 domain-containing protein [Verrucomicrobiota bacterium]